MDDQAEVPALFRAALLGITPEQRACLGGEETASRHLDSAEGAAAAIFARAAARVVDGEHQWVRGIAIDAAHGRLTRSGRADYEAHLHRCADCAETHRRNPRAPKPPMDRFWLVR